MKVSGPVKPSRTSVLVRCLSVQCTRSEAERSNAAETVWVGRPGDAQTSGRTSHDVCTAVAALLLGSLTRTGSERAPARATYLPCTQRVRPGGEGPRRGISVASFTEARARTRNVRSHCSPLTSTRRLRAHPSPWVLVYHGGDAPRA